MFTYVCWNCRKAYISDPFSWLHDPSCPRCGGTKTYPVDNELEPLENSSEIWKKQWLTPQGVERIVIARLRSLYWDAWLRRN